MKLNFSDFSTVAALHFQPRRGQVYAKLAGELALVDSDSGVYYGLDPVGARIWNLLVDFKTPAEIRSILLTEYDVDAHQLENDLATLFGDLFGKGLIELAPDGAAAARKSHEVIPEFR
jgi:hypothetical protein